jgi:hypothetical protein
VIVFDRSFYLPLSSRTALKEMNLSPKRETMGICKHMFVVIRREYGLWT